MSSPEKVFVAWDMSAQNLRLTLERLPEYRPGGFEFEVLGFTTKGGFIHDHVIDGICEADRVLVCTDRPNANVGFEAGFALGLGKPVLMVHRGRKLPEWVDTPPIRNYLQGFWHGISELEALIASEDSWYRTAPAPELPANGYCLDLCPTEGDGEILRRERRRLELFDWRYVDDLDGPLKLDQLNSALLGAARLVWTITDAAQLTGEDLDLRDGASNTAHAIIAGWFFARCYEYREANAPFWVLRLKGARKVVDVSLFEETFEDAPQYTKLILEEIEPVWRAMLPGGANENASAQGDTSVVRIAVIPFDSPDDSEDGGAFADGLTDDLIAAVAQIDLIETVPRDSVMHVRKFGLDNEAAAELLDAQYVVRGSLKRQKGDCLVEVQLYRSGAAVPMRSYRRRHPWEDVLDTTVATSIARGIARSVDRLVTEEVKLQQHDNAAKELFWRAGHALDRYNNTRDPEAADLARRLLFRTYLTDESYQEALVKMGFLSVVRWETTGDPRLLRDSVDTWNGILRRSPDHPVALAEVGYVRFLLGENRDGAIDLVRKAAHLQPDHPIVGNVLALLYLFMGFYESSIALEKEVALADPAYVYPLTNASLAHQLMGRHDKALEMARRAGDLDPTAFAPTLLQGVQQYHLGNPRDAVEVWSRGQDAASIEVLPIFDAALGWVSARSEDQTTAAITINRYRGDTWLQGWYGPYYAALTALSGRLDAAVGLLEKASGFASSYRYLIADPNLRPLYAHRGFQSLLRRRYAEWLRSLERLSEDMPIPPADQPSPDAFC